LYQQAGIFFRNVELWNKEKAGNREMVEIRITMRNRLTRRLAR
jgi:hypothetical protein